MCVVWRSISSWWQRTTVPNDRWAYECIKQWDLGSARRLRSASLVTWVYTLSSHGGEQRALHKLLSSPLTCAMARAPPPPRGTCKRTHVHNNKNEQNKTRIWSYSFEVCAILMFWESRNDCNALSNTCHYPFVHCLLRFIYFICVRALHPCLCVQHTHAWYPEIRRGCWTCGTGIWTVVNCSVGAKKRTWVLCKSSKHSWLPSLLSSLFLKNFLKVIMFLLLHICIWIIQAIFTPLLSLSLLLPLLINSIFLLWFFYLFVLR